MAASQQPDLWTNLNKKEKKKKKNKLDEENKNTGCRKVGTYCCHDHDVDWHRAMAIEVWEAVSLVVFGLLLFKTFDFGIGHLFFKSLNCAFSFKKI